MSLDALRAADPEVFAAVAAEIRRQNEGLELIASENFVSPAILEAAGTALTNKYAEGYPGKRYYGGCENVDTIERLALSRAQALFGAAHANVQPYSGAIANTAAYFALLNPGDPIMAMNLAHGGHLTHGMAKNFSGRFFRVIPYGVNPQTEQLDYDELSRIAQEHKPKLIVAGATAYPRTIDFARFREIADSVGAMLMVDMAHIAGLVVAGEHPSPIPHADVVTSTTHKTLRGPRSGLILCREAHAKAIDSAVFPGLQGGPLCHIIAAKAVAFKLAAEPSFRVYQKQVVANARALAAALVGVGLRIVSGGTDNHLVLVDLSAKSITGKQGEALLDEAGITVNKNAIPFDPRPPAVGSGIRVGTPAVTTRGLKEPEMATLAGWIGEIVAKPDDAALRARIRAEVRTLCARFPLYPDV